MLQESLHTLILQLTNHTGTQILHLLIHIRQLFITDTGTNTVLLGFIEEIKHQRRCLLKGQNLQFEGILKVHNLITDIIRSLHKINQRIARPAFMARCCIQLRDTQLLCHRFVKFTLRDKETELCLRRSNRWKRVFYDTRQRTIGHRKATLTTAFKTMSQQTKSIGITIEFRNVAPELRRYPFFQIEAFSLRKECLDSLLS